jgi:glycosyltransferase involved in cell wall biosynthesis
VNVLLDLRCLETPSAQRGIGRYARELALALPRAAPEWRFSALSWAGVGAALGVADVRYPGPRRGIGWADRWILPRLLRERGVDLYHSTAYALPTARTAGTALVLTVHDLVAELFPHALSLRHRLAFARTFRSAAAAQRVVTVSETTRRDLLARHALVPERVVAVPNGVSLRFRGPAASPAPSGFPRPFVLYVGGLDPLKNVLFLLDVVARAREESCDVHLVVAGEEGPRRRALALAAGRRGLSARVHAVGYLADDRLAAAYREALAFVFPSRYEGFGLPPLEAMAAGCPVVSSPAGALAEVLGDAAILCDPTNARPWASAIAMLLRDPAARGARVAAGVRRAASFTWERTALETLAVYRSALAGVAAA